MSVPVSRKLIALTGFMGCGKTTVGRLLAERREQERVLVPFGNAGVEAGRDDDPAAESRLQRRVAADVVGVRVGI